jgi:hypothetical protein
LYRVASTSFTTREPTDHSVATDRGIDVVGPAKNSAGKIYDVRKPAVREILRRMHAARAHLAVEDDFPISVYL